MQIRYFAFIAILGFSCNTTKKATTDTQQQKGIPVFAFETRFIDLGVVKKGETRDLEFPFINRGDVDMVIELATSCHCTTLDYPMNTPIPPGKGGVIKAHFDSSEKDESELIDITLILANENPLNGYPIVDEVKFHFDLEK